MIKKHFYKIQVCSFFISSMILSSTAFATDYPYFKFSKAFHSNAVTARKTLTIYNRAGPDNISPLSYSGACTYSYGANTIPAMNEGTATSLDFPQYLTKEKRDYNFFHNNEFTIGAYVDFPHPSAYSVAPTYTALPHFCETSPVGFQRAGVTQLRNKTTIGNIFENSLVNGSFIRLRSLNGIENLFNFEFKPDRINLETKGRNWWADAFGWKNTFGGSAYFYPNFNTIGAFHGPQASLGVRNANTASQTPIGDLQHLYLNFKLKNNVQNSLYNTVPYGVNVQSYAYPPNFPIPSTGQKNYEPNKHGGGLRFGITFRFADNATFCSATASQTKIYAFNMVENIFDERFEYIDQAPSGQLYPSFKYLAVDPSSGQNMYRYPLQKLLPEGIYVRNGIPYNPFKIRGVVTEIKDKDLMPILKEELIPNLIQLGAFPAMPQCGKTIEEYYSYILKHLYVPTASVGYETGGVNDLSFSLLEFSLVGSNIAK